MSTTWPVRVFALLAALFWGFFFFGLIDLVVPIVRQPGFYASNLLETGWGVLFVLFVGAPLIAVACAPNLVAPVVQVALVGLAVALVAFIVPEWLQLLPAAALLLTSAVLVWLSGGRWRQGALTSVRSASVHRGTLILVGVGAIPLAIFVADLVAGRREGRPPTDDITLGLDHWPMQAALAVGPTVGIVLTAGLASTISGWPVCAWTAVAGAAWMGGFSIGYPTHAGSFGELGGWAAVTWACVLAASTVARTSRARARARGVRDPTFIDDDAPEAGSWHRSPRSRPSRTHGPMAVDAPWPSLGGGRELAFASLKCGERCVDDDDPPTR